MATCSRSGFEPTEGCPSFFKVIRYPSSPHLALPVAFVRNYFEKIPKNPTLKTATGGHSWKLKLVKIGEDFCFGDGWDKLANDVELRIREIVVFWLIDPFTFQVSFLDANGCAKDLLPNTKINNGDRSNDVDDDNEVDLCFQKTISIKTHRYYVTLPVSFVKAAGLENKTSIKMIDHEGRAWTLGILAERYRRVKYSLSKPWCQFRRCYQLSNGDICSFKFDKKEGVLNLTKLARAKPRPPQHSIKIEDEWSPVDDDDVRVKVEYDESGGEIKVNRRRLPEHQSGSLEAANTKLGRINVDKPSVAQLQIQPDRVLCKRVVYF